MTKKKITAIFLPVVFVFAFAFSAIASDQKGYLPKDETTQGDYISASEAIDVAGTVNGDVIVAGGIINFSGNASGDILAAGGNLRINGENDGNIRAAGGNISIEGGTKKNVTIAGGNFVTGEDSVVAGNLYFMGGSAEIRGDVGGNLKVVAGNFLLSGNIEGDAEIMADEITIRPGAKINGNLTYYNDKDLQIEPASVAGEIIRKKPILENGEESSLASFFVSKLIGFLGFLILAFVFYKLFPKNSKNVVDSLLKNNAWKMLAFGILAVILVPIAFIILLVSVIGMPLAFVLMFAFISALLLTRVSASIALGRYINEKLKPRETPGGFPLMDFVLGYIILEVLIIIPVLGGLASFLIFVWALGGLASYVYGGMKGMDGAQDMTKNVETNAILRI